MNDSLYELLIKRNPTFLSWLARISYVLLIIAVAVVPLPFLGPLSFPLAVAFAFFFYRFFFSRLNVEYEYILLNHDLSIDVIYNRQTRKQLFSFDIQTADIIAPANSPRLQSYHPKKTINCTSGKPDAAVYCIMITINQAPNCIRFEPNEKMLELMKPWMESSLYFD